VTDDQRHQLLAEATHLKLAASHLGFLMERTEADRTTGVIA